MHSLNAAVAAKRIFAPRMNPGPHSGLRIV
jgi:hypothetical protein